MRHTSSSAKVESKRMGAPTAGDNNSYLQNKEEEYKRLNAELEKKTATLVFEAEQVLRANEKLLNEADYLDKISEVNFLHADKEDKSEKFTSVNNNNKLDLLRAKKLGGDTNSSLVNANELNSFKRTIKHFQETNTNENDDYGDKGDIPNTL